VGSYLKGNSLLRFDTTHICPKVIYNHLKHKTIKYTNIYLKKIKIKKFEKIYIYLKYLFLIEKFILIYD
jgi:hypothetical protein